MSKRLQSESGYSLVEVLAAIVILSLAILPMVGMFDAGLRATTTSGSYDRARALANANLESAQAMDFDQASVLSKCPQDGESGFDCNVDTTYVLLETTGDTAEFKPAEAPSGMAKVTVTVSWDSRTYETTGIIAE